MYVAMKPLLCPWKFWHGHPGRWAWGSYSPLISSAAQPQSSFWEVMGLLMVANTVLGSMHKFRPQICISRQMYLDAEWTLLLLDVVTFSEHWNLKILGQILLFSFKGVSSDLHWHIQEQIWAKESLNRTKLSPPHLLLKTMELQVLIISENWATVFNFTPSFQYHLGLMVFKTYLEF